MAPTAGAAAAGSLPAGVNPSQCRVTRSGAGRGPQQEAGQTAAVTTRGRARDAATCKQAAPCMGGSGEVSTRSRGSARTTAKGKQASGNQMTSQERAAACRSRSRGQPARSQSRARSAAEGEQAAGRDAGRSREEPACAQSRAASWGRGSHQPAGTPVPPPCPAASAGSGPGERGLSSRHAAAPEGSAAPQQSDQGAQSGRVAALGAAIDPSLMRRRSARGAGLPVDALASPPGSCEKPGRLGARSQAAQPAATEPGPPPAAEAPVREHTAPSVMPGTGSAAVQGRDASPAVSQCKQSRTRKRKRAGQQTSAQPDAAPSVPAPGQPGSALEGLTPASPGAEVPVELPEGGPAATNRQRPWQQQVTGSQAPGQPACSPDMSVPELRAHSRQQPGCGKDEVPLGPLDAKGCQLPDRRDDEGMPLGQLAALRCQLPGDVPLGQLAAAQQLLTSAEAAKHGTARCGEQRRHSSDLAGWAQEGGMAMQASRIRFAIAQCQGGAASSVARAAPVPPAAAAEHGQAQGTAAGAAPPASNAAAAAQEHSQLQGALTAAAATQEPGQAEGPPAATAPSPDQLPAYNAIAAGHTPAPGGRNRKGKREGREGAARHSEEATPSGELALGDGC